jgi:hypothetical protein
MPWAAAGAVAGGVIGAVGSMSAASTASGAAKDAANLQAQQFATTRGDLLPYNTAGQSVLGDLTALARSGPYGGGKNYLAMAEGMLPGQMTQAQLEQTPGYQFNLAQGLKATQSAAAARGLGVSGAAIKGAASYATGLADSTYQQQFQNAQTRYGDVLNLNTGQQTNLQNQYNRLLNTAQLGESAGAQTGQQGTQAAAAGGSFLNQAGQASAAGTMGAANALTGGINSYLGYNALKQYTGGTGGYGGQNNSDLIPAGGFNSSGNTWYN